MPSTNHLVQGVQFSLLNSDLATITQARLLQYLMCRDALEDCLEAAAGAKCVAHLMGEDHQKHITLVLQSLQWLPAPFQAQFKVKYKSPKWLSFYVLKEPLPLIMIPYISREQLSVGTACVPSSLGQNERKAVLCCCSLALDLPPP